MKLKNFRRTPANHGSPLFCGGALLLVAMSATFGCSEGAESPKLEDSSSTGGTTAVDLGTGGTGADTGGADSATGGASSAAGGTDAGTGGSLGVQLDPGTEGDGTYDQPEPYAPPPEALSRLNGAPEGTLSGSQFYPSPSIYPGFIFEYWIYVPAQYQPGQPAALMVFGDGANYNGDSTDLNTPIVFDNLIHEGAMPPTIGLFLQPGSMTPSGVFDYNTENDSRRAQYGTPDATYSRFLLEEAIPDLIVSAYDIVDDPDGWALGGHSSSGVAALIAAWFNPDEFHKVLAHNCAFPHTGGVFPELMASVDPALPLRVNLLGSSNDLADFFATNNRAAEIFEEKGYHYRYLSGTGMHYPPLQAEADYAEALRWLWRGYSLPWYP